MMQPFVSFHVFHNFFLLLLLAFRFSLFCCCRFHIIYFFLISFRVGVCLLQFYRSSADEQKEFELGIRCRSHLASNLSKKSHFASSPISYPPYPPLSSYFARNFAFVFVFESVLVWLWHFHHVFCNPREKNAKEENQNHNNNNNNNNGRSFSPIVHVYVYAVQMKESKREREKANERKLKSIKMYLLLSIFHYICVNSV